MSHSISFDHNPEAVKDAMTDPAIVEARCLARGEQSAEISWDGDDDDFTVYMTRVVEQDIPAFAAKLFSPVQTTTFEERWQRAGDGWKGTIKMNVEGAPVSMTADFTLTPQGDGSVYKVNHKPKAKIPLIGGKIEKFIQGQIDDGLDKEMAFTKSHLG